MGGNNKVVRKSYLTLDPSVCTMSLELDPSKILGGTKPNTKLKVIFYKKRFACKQCIFFVLNASFFSELLNTYIQCSYQYI